uniref:Uncharacterized protein n=1 Tax=Cacopsylla melanoneura TaxID=428564 RepID=A0A8D8LF65_9HEMI
MLPIIIFNLTQPMRNCLKKTLSLHRTQRDRDIMLAPCLGCVVRSIFPRSRPGFNPRPWTKSKPRSDSPSRRTSRKTICTWTESRRLKPLRKHLRTRNCPLRNTTASPMWCRWRLCPSILTLSIGSIRVPRLYLTRILPPRGALYPLRLRKCPRL